MKINVMHASNNEKINFIRNNNILDIIMHTNPNQGV